MKDMKQIGSDIRKMVQDTVDSGTIGHFQFFVERVLQENSEIYGNDSAFYQVCAREVVSKLVKSAITKYEVKGSSAPTLHGFEHLQTAYPMMRNGDHVLVPIELCSDDELLVRSDEYEATANTIIRHAIEIRAYVMARSEEKSA